MFVDLNLSHHYKHVIEPLFSFANDSPFITLNAVLILDGKGKGRAYI